MGFPWRGLIVQGGALLLSRPSWDSKKPKDGVIAQLPGFTAVSVQSQTKEWLYIKTEPAPGQQTQSGYVAQDKVVQALSEDLVKARNNYQFPKGLDYKSNSKKPVVGPVVKNLGSREYLAKKSDKTLWHFVMDIQQTDHLNGIVDYKFSITRETPLDEYEKSLKQSLEWELRYPREKPLEESHIVAEVIFTVATLGAGKIVGNAASHVFAKASSKIPLNGAAIKLNALLVETTIEAVNKGVLNLSLASTANALGLLAGLIPGIPSITSITKILIPDLAVNALWTALWERSLRTITAVQGPWVVTLASEGSARLLGTLSNNSASAGFMDSIVSDKLTRISQCTAFRELTRDKYFSMYLPGKDPNQKK
ncbi:MAG TPA: hypothetical protein VK458_25300 [Myxococcaceae bacterium]|nr:hypothetical protein [Myxococcaceae bacterium]